MQAENACTFMWMNVQIRSYPHTSDKSLMLQNQCFPWHRRALHPVRSRTCPFSLTQRYPGAHMQWLLWLGTDSRKSCDPWLQKAGWAQALQPAVLTQPQAALHHLHDSTLGLYNWDLKKLTEATRTQSANNWRDSTSGANRLSKNTARLIK